MYFYTSKISKNKLSDADFVKITGKYLKHAQSLIDILLVEGDYNSAEKLKSIVARISDTRRDLLVLTEE